MGGLEWERAAAPVWTDLMKIIGRDDQKAFIGGLGIWYLGLMIFGVGGCYYSPAPSCYVHLRNAFDALSLSFAMFIWSLFQFYPHYGLVLRHWRNRHFIAIYGLGTPISTATIMITINSIAGMRFSPYISINMLLFFILLNYASGIIFLKVHLQNNRNTVKEPAYETKK